MFKIYIIGYENHIQPVDDMDIAFCKPYTKEKPLPVPPEFLDIADILIREQGWSQPTNCENALRLYINLALYEDHVKQ